MSLPFCPSRGRGSLPRSAERNFPLRFSKNLPPGQGVLLTQLVCPSESVQQNKGNGTAYAMPFLFYGFSAGAFVPFAVFGCFAALLLSPVTASAPSRMALPTSSTASPTALPASSTPSRTSSPTVFVLVSRRSSTALLVPLLVPLPLSVPLSLLVAAAAADEQHRQRRQQGDQLFHSSPS